MNELTKIFDSASKVEIKSITDSLFKYGLLFCVLAVLSALTATPWIIITLFCFGGSLIVAGLSFYWYHSVKNPDYLRSETYQLKKRSLELLGDKDTTSAQITDILQITGPDESAKTVKRNE
jgi:hypothetical protein